MKTKHIIIVILLLSLSLPSFPQITYDISRPSINAEQFSMGVKAETSLSKGQVSLNIPLMELKGKGYNLPISLMFYSDDVTFTTEATPIGLGWSLMAGGAITKTIKGRDDTCHNPFSTDHHTNGNYVYDRYNRLLTYSTFADDIRMDPMPDEYTYSLPGHSGTIDVSIEGNTINMKLYPDESYIIESLETGYCITADDGTKFYFTIPEYLSRNENSESTSFFSG